MVGIIEAFERHRVQNAQREIEKGEQTKCLQGLQGLFAEVAAYPKATHHIDYKSGRVGVSRKFNLADLQRQGLPLVEGKPDESKVNEVVQILTGCRFPENSVPQSLKIEVTDYNFGKNGQHGENHVIYLNLGVELKRDERTKPERIYLYVGYQGQISSDPINIDGDHDAFCYADLPLETKKALDTLKQIITQPNSGTTKTRLANGLIQFAREVNKR